MDPEISKKLDEQEAQLLRIYLSVEKTRKYFLWTLIVTVVMLILPLIGLLIAIPSFISTYTSGLQ
ncbi:MAG: hypothetical protein ACM3NH_00185 [Candidatus Saccharibacteria bacterium]